MFTSRLSSTQRNTQRLTTTTLLALLFLSGISVAYVALPANAATATITLSPTSGSGALGDPAGNTGTSVVATLVTVTGTGFLPNQDNIKVGYIALGKAVSTANFNALYLLFQSLVGSSGAVSTAPSYARADASGTFIAKFYIPQLQAGAYSIVADYTPSQGSETLTTAATFTVNAAIKVFDFAAAGKFIYNTPVNIAATGFKGSETVSITPTNLLVSAVNGATAISSFVVDANGATCTQSLTTGRCLLQAATYSATQITTTGVTITGTGISTSCSSATTTCNIAGYIGSRPGGSVTVAASGQTSSIPASTSITITPAIALVGTTLFSPATTLSLSTTAGTVYFTGTNFGASSTTTTAAVNSNSLILNVGGQNFSTIHARVTNPDTAGASGNIGPFGVTYTATLPAGQVVVYFNGTKYSWANYNIIAPAAVVTAENAAGGTGTNTGPMAPRGTILTSSTVPFLVTDASSYRPVRDTPFVFLLGFTSGGTISGAGTTYQPTDGTASITAFALYGGSSSGAATIDTLGAGLFWACNNAFTAGGTTSGSCSTAAYAVPNSYGANNVITVTDSGAKTGTATITATPSMRNPATSGTVTVTSGSNTAGTISASPAAQSTTSNAFQRVARFATQLLEVTGFKETSAGVVDSSFTITLTNTATSAVTTWTTVSSVCGTTAPCYSKVTSANGVGQYMFALPAFQTELAGGTYTLTVTGTTTGNVATNTITVAPSIFGAALSLAAGVTSGNTIAIISSTTVGGQGIHGLLASTSYNVMLDGPSGTKVGSFTSTSQGLVPPGTQFTMPATSSGVHIVDLVNAATGASAIWGNVIPRDTGISQFGGATASANELATTSTTACTSSSCTGNTGLTVYSTGNINASPSVGLAGTKVSVTATGLQPSKTYYVVLPSTSSGTACSGLSYSTFTSSSAGSGNATFTFPAMATSSGNEQGTTVALGVSTGNPLTTCDGGTVNFILQAGATLSSTSGPAGTSTTLTASGLVSSQAYNIVFDYAISSGTGNTWTGTIVGGLTGGSDGSASAAVTIPSTASAGVHSIELTVLGGSSHSGNCAGAGSSVVCAALATPITFTVGTGSTTGCTGTNCFTASGTPAQTSINGQQFVTISYTNSGSAQITGVVYAVVHNAAGQTVQYTTGTITPNAGQTVPAYLALSGLPSGTYSVTVFVVTTSGTAISTTSTVSVTI